MSNTPNPLTPPELPALSDASAVEILEFLHELVFRFEAHYFGQIHRYYYEQRELFTQAPLAPSPDDDVPF